MASLVPSLIVGSLPRLGQGPGAVGGVEGWLKLATLVPLGSEGSLRFEIDGPELSLPYIAHDYERFALASAESFMRAKQGSGGAINFSGWRLLELYYAAFFAAHSLMRSQGAGVAMIGGDVAKRLRDIASLYEVEVDALQPGSWFYKIDWGETAAPSIEFSTSLSGSGVHDAFWREFCRFMKSQAERAVEEQLPDSADFLIGMDEILKLIRTGGDNSASWLAKVRNEINYKHALRAWYPEPKSKEACLAADSVKLFVSSSVKLDSSKSKEPLLAFAKTCNFLISLSFEVASYLAERSTRGGAFGQRWRKFQELGGLKLVA